MDRAGFAQCPEAVAAILREMRGEGGGDVAGRMFREYADRLEAAVSAHCRNAAAMRAALDDIRERLVASVHDGTIDPHEALGIVEAALSAPPRNCDRYATWDKAWDAFSKSYFGPTDPGELEYHFGVWLFAKEKTRP